MKNIKITAKYFQVMKNVFIAAALVMVLPIFTSAQTITEDTISRGTIAIQEYGLNLPNENPGWDWEVNGNYNEYGNNYYSEVTNFDVLNYDQIPVQNGWDWQINSYQTPVQSGWDWEIGNQNQVNNSNTTFGYPTYNPSVVSSGGFNINTESYPSYPTQNNYYSNNSYYPMNSTVVSGGFIDYGNPNYTQSSYYVPPPSTVTTGTFSAQPNNSLPSTYVTPEPSTVYSGTYSEGGYPTYNYAYSQPTYYYPQQPSQVTLNQVPNQVLAYTNTNPNLDSVYLSDVPSTGFNDYYGIIVFVSLLVSWSAMLSYVILKRKIKSQMLPVEALVNGSKENKTSIHPNFTKQNISDSSDISKVEEYARINKVLLSSDASVKIVKLARLGKINATEFIKGISKGEWIAVGESQIIA